MIPLRVFTFTVKTNTFRDAQQGRYGWFARTVYSVLLYAVNEDNVWGRL